MLSNEYSSGVPKPPPEQLSLPDINGVEGESDQNPHDYKLLVGHRRTDGSMKSTDELHAEYVQLTDEIIFKITEGVDVTDPVSGERTVARPDYVIWLDKSARPVAWLTKELWPLLARNNETGEVPPMPENRFVNIDREQWVNTVDPLGTGHMDIDRVDESVIRSLRSIFVEPKHKKEGLTSEIDQAPSDLDGKTILIVDEVRSTGRTLDIAQKFFNKAFPTSRVATTHWMKGIATAGKGMATGNADIPIWYKDNDVTGRGVGNRDERASQHSRSRTQRLGSWFLSTQLKSEKPETGEPTQDSDSKELRKEMKWLAQDAQNGEVLIIPAVMRDDAQERIAQLNGGMDLEEFRRRKSALKS